jgi:hypothetical protein
VSEQAGKHAPGCGEPAADVIMCSSSPAATHSTCTPDPNPCYIQAKVVNTGPSCLSLDPSACCATSSCWQLIERLSCDGSCDLCLVHFDLHASKSSKRTFPCKSRFGSARYTGTQVRQHASRTETIRRLMVAGWLRGNPDQMYKDPT